MSISKKRSRSEGPPDQFGGYITRPQKKDCLKQQFGSQDFSRSNGMFLTPTEYTHDVLRVSGEGNCMDLMNWSVVSYKSSLKGISYQYHKLKSFSKRGYRNGLNSSPSLMGDKISAKHYAASGDFRAKKFSLNIKACRSRMPSTEKFSCAGSGDGYLLLGRWFDDREFSDDRFLKFFQEQWSQEVWIVHRERSFLIIGFGTEDQMISALRNGPYVLEGGLLCLSMYRKEESLGNSSFSKILIWIRLYNVPKMLLNKAMGQGLATFIGDVEKVRISFGLDQKSQFLRAQVWIDPYKPLIPGFFLIHGNQHQIWVSCGYERILKFCTRCGVIGHPNSRCDFVNDELLEGFVNRSVLQHFAKQGRAVAYEAAEDRLECHGFQNTRCASGRTHLTNKNNNLGFSHALLETEKLPKHGETREFPEFNDAIHLETQNYWFAIENFLQSMQRLCPKAAETNGIRWQGLEELPIRNKNEGGINHMGDDRGQMYLLFQAGVDNTTMKRKYKQDIRIKVEHPSKKVKHNPTRKRKADGAANFRSKRTKKQKIGLNGKEVTLAANKQIKRRRDGSILGLPTKFELQDFLGWNEDEPPGKKICRIEKRPNLRIHDISPYVQEHQVAHSFKLPGSELLLDISMGSKKRPLCTIDQEVEDGLLCKRQKKTGATGPSTTGSALVDVMTGISEGLPMVVPKQPSQPA